MHFKVIWCPWTYPEQLSSTIRLPHRPAISSAGFFSLPFIDGSGENIENLPPYSALPHRQ